VAGTVAGTAGREVSAFPERDLAVRSRRREAGGAGARSLLLTMLGEFALPRRAPVWTATFVDALAAVGVEEKAARQALARTAGEGLLVAERVGRRTRWSLSPRATRLLEDGTARIYGFMRGGRPWDGRWLVLAVTVPESRRQLRHRLRVRLTWAGMGSPAQGLWVVPDAGKIDEVTGIVADLGIAASVMSWVGTSAAVGDPQAVVRAAWRLDQVEAAYHDFVAAFSGRVVTDLGSAFRAQVELVQAWRRFPFVDPALPAELLEHDWPGVAAAATFHERHDAWRRRADAHWDALCAGAEQRA